MAAVTWQEVREFVDLVATRGCETFAVRRGPICGRCVTCLARELQDRLAQDGCDGDSAEDLAQSIGAAPGGPVREETRTMSERRPGKFEGCDDQDLGEMLYGITQEGGCEAELGDGQDFGWYGLLVNVESPTVSGLSYIVSEDSQGFFDYTEFTTEQLARQAWGKLEKEYEADCEADRG
jgi:hypothetical protein